MGFIRALQTIEEAMKPERHPLRIAEINDAIGPLVTIRYPSDTGTAVKCLKHIGQALRYFMNIGIEYLSDIESTHVEDFFWIGTQRNSNQEPSVSTAANRQWALRVMFQLLAELEVWDRGDPTGPTIGREHSRSSRPASDEELDRIRVVSRNQLVSSGDEILVALSLCGGTASEVARITPEDVDLDESLVRFRTREGRVNPIGGWEQEVLADALATSALGLPLAVAPGLTHLQATHTVTVRLNNVIRYAGFGSTADLTATSIRLGAARQIQERLGLEAAATFLGNQSLDLTARALRYDWWK